MNFRELNLKVFTVSNAQCKKVILKEKYDPNLFQL